MKKKNSLLKRKETLKTNYLFLEFLILLVLTQFSNFFLSDLMKLFKGAMSRFFQLYNKYKTLKTRALK